MSVQLLLDDDADQRSQTPPESFMLVSTINDAQADMKRQASVKRDPPRPQMSTMSSVSEPPSYDEIVNQEQVEKTQRQIWGVFVVYLSHLCGMHPIRAPFFCTLTECKKLDLKDRISVFNIFVCIVNLLVSANHIYLRFFSADSQSLWNSKDKAQWIQAFVASVAPPLVIISSITSSTGLDKLIQLISNEKTAITESQNKKRIKKWFNIMFWLNFSFGVIFVAQFSQIIFMDFISYRLKQRSQQPIDSDFITMQTPLSFCIKRFMIQVDRYYFNFMFFAVVKLPQIIIMIIAIELSVMFSENTRCISRKKLSKERLVEFFDQFRRLETIHAQLESTYSTTILIVIMCKLTISTVKSYVLVRYLANEAAGLSVVRFVFNNDGEMERKDGHFYMCVLEFGFTLLGIALNFLWTIGFVLSLVYCNDMSRSSTSILLNKLVDDDAKPTKDQILQKLNNPDWGITMGKFKRMDRSAVITMLSLVFTVVAVWIQIGTNQIK